MWYLANLDLDCMCVCVCVGGVVGGWGREGKAVFSYRFRELDSFWDQRQIKLGIGAEIDVDSINYSH